jgi:hypothetical protein
VKESCVGVAINGLMLSRGWLARTDGEDGDFIKTSRRTTEGHCFVLITPSGQKLAEGGPRSADALAAIKAGLNKWKNLTEEERKALPAGKEFRPPEVDRCTPPPGGLILRSFVRNLKKAGRGELATITPIDLKNQTLYPGWQPIYTEPAHINVWLTEPEWRSLVPADPKKGAKFAVPDGIQKRIFRYHLVNGTFGLPREWRPEDVRAGELTLTVEEVAPILRMRLQGSALLATDANLEKAKRGFDARLSGMLTYDPERKAFTRFGVVAIGDYWGGDYEGQRFKRPGRTPLGISFELVAGDNAIDRSPPLVHMDLEQDSRSYFTAEKQR